MQDLAAQQVAGRSRIAGSFDEKPVQPSLRDSWGVLRRKAGSRGAKGGAPKAVV